MKNLVGLWVNLSRAYEIALLGNFSLQIVFDKEYTQGFDDYESIKTFYNDIKFDKDGDLTVEIVKPDYNSKYIEKAETLSDIRLRVATAKLNIKPCEFKNDGCLALLKTATDRLSFSLSKREKVIEISKVIAQLDGSKLIAAEHIAEAVQYNYGKDGKCDAENKKLNFGKGIEISLFDLDFIDIENAIEYLKNLIK